jgi:hypothetical protein
LIDQLRAEGVVVERRTESIVRRNSHLTMVASYLSIGSQ